MMSRWWWCWAEIGEVTVGWWWLCACMFTARKKKETRLIGGVF